MRLLHLAAVLMLLAPSCTVLSAARPSRAPALRARLADPSCGAALPAGAWHHRPTVVTRQSAPCLAAHPANAAATFLQRT